MGLFDAIPGRFIEVIGATDFSQDTMPDLRPSDTTWARAWGGARFRRAWSTGWKAIFGRSGVRVAQCMHIRRRAHEKSCAGKKRGFATVKAQNAGRVPARKSFFLGLLQNFTCCNSPMSYSHLFGNVRFKHILLPVWLSSYTYKSRVFHFMVNGETGKVAGKSPVRALKVLLAVLPAAGLALLAIILLHYFEY